LAAEEEAAGRNRLLGAGVCGPSAMESTYLGVFRYIIMGWHIVRNSQLLAALMLVVVTLSRIQRIAWLGWNF
jgi:hypothetical protein